MVWLEPSKTQLGGLSIFETNKGYILQRRTIQLEYI